MKKIRFLSILLMAFLPISPVYPCGDFLISGSNGIFVNGRSMEFPLDLKSALVVHPRGEKRTSPSPQGQEGLQWSSQYGFVGLNAFGLNSVLDGMNEKGLSAGALWLPGTEYPNPGPQDKNRPLLLNDFIDWILGNFESVEQLKPALNQVTVWARAIPEMGGIPPLHVAIHDSQGKSLVVEFIAGKMNVYDNPTGVLTNAPPFDKMVKTLERFKDLTNLNRPERVNGQTINGSGLLGLPGDWTPPSRFARLATEIKYALPPSDADQAVDLATHILNTVDIPRGVIKSMDTGNPIYEYTQWSVVKDLTRRKLFFRTYEGLGFNFVDLQKIPWERLKTQKQLPIARPLPLSDWTPELLKS